MAKKEYDITLRGYVGGWEFNREKVDGILSRKKDQEVNVLIDSLGGSVNEALSIVEMFNIHGQVNVHFSGMNASAATVASLGAKRITIDRNALYLVHKCLIGVFEWGSMNSDQLQEKIEEMKKQKEDLDKIDLTIAGMYARRCKKPVDKLMELMERGGWLTAEEALGYGFVDELTEGPSEALRVDGKVVADMYSAGMEIPKGLKVEKEGVAEKIFAMLSMLTGKRTDGGKEAATETGAGAAAGGAVPETENDKNKTSNMKTKIIATLLALEMLTATEGKVTLTEEQVMKIDDELDSKGKTLEEKEKEINDLKAEKESLLKKIEDLKKEPAEETHHVVGDGSGEGKGEDPIAEEARIQAEAKELYNLIH